MKLKQAYLYGVDKIKELGVENPGIESSLLLSNILGLNRSEIYIHPEREIDSEDVEMFKGILKRRKNREPIAYILGHCEFYSRGFVVSRGVLVPRPETELLVEEALRAASGLYSPRIIDVGTGSGCIAITICGEKRDSKVFATDISYDALRVARLNAKINGVERDIKFLCADFLGCFKRGFFDIVVSNPPYISDSDLALIDPDVRDFEPNRAISGGKDGLYCVRSIVKGSLIVLKNGGWCILEIGHDQEGRVIEIFRQTGFREISLTNDLSGVSRVIKARWIA